MNRPTKTYLAALRPSDYSREQLEEMRDWIAECFDHPIDFCADELNDGEVLRGIAVHYAGGIAQFLRDSQPVGPEQPRWNIPF
jgi:hypothetical protein